MRVTALRASIRWFRAMDVPSVKPQIFGYKPPRAPREFEAFSSRDSDRIERAWQQRTGGASQAVQAVPVEEDGLVSVDVGSLLCSPTYWDGPAFKVQRALWFEMLGNNRVTPLDPEIDAMVERNWAQKVRSFEVELPEAKNSDETQMLVAEFSGDRLVLREKQSWLSAFRRRYFFRGIPKEDEMQGARTNETHEGPVPASVEQADAKADAKADASDASDASPQSSSKGEFSKRQVKVRPEYRPRKIDHLVFCVHGIGQLLSVKFEQVNFIKDVDELRQLMHRTAAARMGDDGPLAGESHVQVLPVLWRHNLENEIDGLQPAQFFGSSNLAAEAVLDFVMYGSKNQRGRILDTAANQMRCAFQKFCELHPEFAANPRVSVIGHSLGAVISFDLVAEAELGFTVENLFTLGSPLGVLKLIDGTGTEGLKRPKSLYNIMRLSDPVATRLEPLVNPKSLEFLPEPVPGKATDLLSQARELTGGLVTQSEFLASKASSWFQLVTKRPEPLKLKPPKADPKLPELAQFNRHGRLDFSVKETLDISLVLGLAGHLMYLDNADVIAFILREIQKEPM